MKGCINILYLRLHVRSIISAKNVIRNISNYEIRILRCLRREVLQSLARLLRFVVHLINLVIPAYALGNCERVILVGGGITHTINNSIDACSACG